MSAELFPSSACVEEGGGVAFAEFPILPFGRSFVGLWRLIASIGRRGGGGGGNGTTLNWKEEEEEESVFRCWSFEMGTP